MDVKNNTVKGQRKHKDKAEPTFHLAQTSLDIINKIIIGYAHKNGSLKVDEIAKEIGIRETPISVNHAFLMDVGIIKGSSVEKQSTLIGRKLGGILELGGKKDIGEIWQKIIIENSFCINLLDEIASMGEIDKKEFQKRILLLAGYNNPPRDVGTGAYDLIKIFDQAGLITKSGRKFVVSNAYKSALYRAQPQKAKIKNSYITEDHIAIPVDIDYILEQRCFRLLNAGSSEPKVWDSVALCDYNGETTPPNNLVCRAEEKTDGRRPERESIGRYAENRSGCQSQTTAIHCEIQAAHPARSGCLSGIW
jgi:hypothetical protein